MDKKTAVGPTESDRETRRRWRENNPDKVVEEKKRYYQKHKEEIKIKSKERYYEDPKKAQERNRRWVESNREKVSIIKKRWKQKNPLKIMEDKKRRNRAGAGVIRQFKYSGCAVCGEKRIVCLDLHHRNPAEKEGFIHPSWSVSRIENELKKCVVLCANCHRVHHYGEQPAAETGG